jgi:hypothetical protein
MQERNQSRARPDDGRNVEGERHHHCWQARQLLQKAEGGEGPRDDSSVCQKNLNTKPRRALAMHGHFPVASSGVNTQSEHRKASGIKASSWCCRRLNHSQVASQRTEDVNVHSADMAMHRLSTPYMQQPLQKGKTGTRFWRALSLLPGYAIP